MNKRTQILKQITSEKVPNLIEYQPTCIKSISGESMAAPLPEEHLALLGEHISAVAERLKIKASYLHAWLGKFVHAPFVNQMSLLRLIEQYGLDLF